MCGIAGIISEKPEAANLKKVLRKQAHRGPDYTGIYIDNGFASLGHNRLSIIDVSPDANQPFCDSSKRFYLTFNGEIYNYKELRQELRNEYKFQTFSDTEVLLAAFIHWGKNCLQKLNGMFSFAVWDTKNKTLFAARDRFGVKPFYYFSDKESFYFASEIKSLLAVTKINSPNKKVWANYFKYGIYGMPDETFYQQINQIPGGCYLEYSKGILSTSRWYNFEEKIKENPKDFKYNQAKEYYLEMLQESIALRFRADVPVGFNLSGGVDSSLLLALVNQFKKKNNINAYTFYTGDRNYDELPWVEEMISYTNNPLNTIKFEAREVGKTSKFISEIQDEPFGGIPTMAYSEIFKRAKKDGVKVLLDGQGMDEQWAGYDYYLNTHSVNIQGIGGKKPFKSNVLKKELLQESIKPEYPEPFAEKLQNLQYRDLFYTKIPRALRFNDRVSMAYSTELREPFLDYRLVEFAFAQPRNFKIKGEVQKFLIREILMELTTRKISNAPKRPLQTPQREWLGNELKEYVSGNLEKLKSCSVADWFDHKEIEKEWRSYQEGENTSSFHIWQWINTAHLFS
ncbi:asparagine synthase (glutamine-hydrolyzing) [uncultured Christiangramia sp.]|uniref:asparagine synthase (glutamine-hydrolyzing) n=1 Tax=Christiangramia sp. 3-2217-3z TaxID=3417564 RepID=UPI00260E27A4|nr:asparagine synthase (glutamine-hydrolyzing) [uncultured Christiangramia sp.]